MKRIVASIIFSLAFAASAFAQEAKPIGDSERGAAIAQRWCGECHLVDARKDTQDTAPPFMAIAHDPNKGPDYLRGFLVRPHPPMPPLQLSQQEIADLVAYFAELARR